MKNSQQPQTEERRVIWDSRRRPEDDMDDRPILPTRSSAIVNMVRDEEMVPLPDLYPTLSNLHRHGVAVGQPVGSKTSNSSNSSRSDEWNGNRGRPQQYHLENHHPQRQQQDHFNLRRLQIQEIYNQLPTRTRRPAAADTAIGDSIPSKRRPCQRPQTVDVPRREVRQLLSELTIAADLDSFDGIKFEAMPRPSEDYLDDLQLREYLDQLAKEEDRKSRERELLKEQMFASSAAGKEEREALSQLLQQFEFGGGSGYNEDYEEFLNRLLEEQLQAEEQCKIKSSRRESEISV